MLAGVPLLLFFLSAVFGTENATGRDCVLLSSTPLTRFEFVTGYEMSILSSLSYAPWTEFSSIYRNVIDFEVGYSTRNNRLWENAKHQLCMFTTSFASHIKYIFAARAFFKLSKNMKNNTTSIIGLSGNTLMHPRSHAGQCPSKNAYRDSFRLLWFMDGWSEKGIWHDTEVLVAESDHNVIFIFRGTESTADVLTSARRFSHVSQSPFAATCSKGSLHKGMLAAYSRVDRGTIVHLSQHANSDSGRFDTNIHDVFRNCTAGRTRTGESGAHKCAVRDVKLSRLLVDAAMAALRKGKRVICTGHSLGGALASLMALDLLVNEPHRPQLLPDLEHVILLLSNLYLVTFGEPEIADNAFFYDLFSRFDHIAAFAAQRYRRFVSLSRAPGCSADVITTVTARIDRIVGATVMGLPRGSRWMKSRRGGDNTRGRGVPRGSSSTKASMSSPLHPMYRRFAADSWGERKQRRRGGRGGRSDMEKVSSIRSIEIQQRQQLQENHESTDELGRELPATSTAAKPSSENAALVLLKQGERLTKYSDADVTPDRMSYFTPPTYVCSGRAAGSFQAHGLLHYSRGLVRAAEESGLFAAIDVIFDSESGEVGASQLGVVQVGGKSKGIYRVDDGWTGDARGAAVVLMHKIPPYVMRGLRMLNEECFRLASNGYGTYVC